MKTVAKRLGRKNIKYTHGSTTTTTINYSFEKKILEIEFKTGKVYHYLKVPADLWEDYRTQVESGKSSGEFFNAKVRDQYEYLEIG